jgi:hypothetical protein
MLRDQAVLHLLSTYCCGVRFLCTEENPKTVEILKQNFPPVDMVKCARQAEKLEGILVIGYEGTPKVSEISRHFKKLKVLCFEPNQNKVTRRFFKVPKKFPAAQHKENDVKLHARFFEEGYRHLYTNSFGTLGKAINLGMFEVCIVNGAIYKPFIACTLKKTKETVKEEIARYRLELICQNAARILRGQGKKVIIFYDVTESDLQEIVKRLRLSEMTDNPCHVQAKKEGYIYECAHTFLEIGGILDETEENPTKERLSKKQRIGKKEELQKTKDAQERAKILAKINESQKMLSEGKTERDITRKLHLDRLSTEKQEEFWQELRK